MKAYRMNFYKLIVIDKMYIVLTMTFGRPWSEE